MDRNRSIPISNMRYPISNTSWGFLSSTIIWVRQPSDVHQRCGHVNNNHRYDQQPYWYASYVRRKKMFLFVYTCIPVVRTLGSGARGLRVLRGADEASKLKQPWVQPAIKKADGCSHSFGTITGGPSQIDLRYTQKPIYAPILLTILGPVYDGPPW